MTSPRPITSLTSAYYELGKPGIVYANALTAAAGFFLATTDTPDWQLFLAMEVGLALIIASACATNNYFDRDIDAIMERTKSRSIPAGRLAPNDALIFGGVTGILGAVTLFHFTNFLTASIAIFAWVVYVAFYTPLKRRTGYALFVGAIAGAAPPVVGYVAVIPELNVTVLAIFLFLFLWQIPHFIAIAIYRYSDYQAAGIPLLVKGPPAERARKYARMSFYLSLIVLLVWCAILVFHI